MHLRKAKSSEHHSHIRKFLDNGKDPLRRLKSLRSGLEKASVVSCKEIVTDNASAVFHVFYASFTSLEQTIHDRVQKGRNTIDQVKELLDVVLPSLEKIIVFVPEKIHKRWQYNSTCLVIRKLLHPDNTIELRQYGIRLLVLWLQALQENAGDAAIELFASAIPRFPPFMTPDGLPGSTSLSSSSSNATSLCERYGVYSSTLTDSDAQLPELPPSTTAFPADYSTIPGNQDWVSTSVLYPLCAASPSSIDPTLQLMEHLLSCLTNQVGRLKWSDTANHMKGFSFLFYQFKLFYLACLYQNFRSDAGLYAPIPPPEIKNPLAADDGSLLLSRIDSDSVLLSPRAGEEEREDSLRNRSNSSTSSKRPTHSITVSTVIKLHYDTSDPIYNAIRQLILKYVLRWIMPGYHSNRPGSILPKQTTPSPSILSPVEEAFIPKGSDLMRDTWFTSRDNVNLLFEIFHKGFQLSLSHPGIVNRLTELYVSWVMDSEKPLFMQPPMSDSLAETSLMPPSGGEMLVSPASSLSVVPWEIISGYSKFDRSSICAGVLPSLRMFVAHSSQLFLHKAKDATTLGNQVESCNRIIKLYQDIAQQWLLDKEGWEYLLAVLLYLVQELLREDPPTNRETTLGGCLADNLLHTLFVCYVKASMVAELSNTMWDRLVTVISSLTEWREVVTQWKVAMRSMTQCLARVVYHLDLENPPLQQIEETHHFRKRSVTQTKAKPLDLYRKPSFGDFRPRGPPRTRAKTANKRTSSSPKIVKAVTVDGESPSSSLHGTPNDYHRRTSTPATIPNRPASPYSSETMPLYRRILSRENRVDEKGSDLEGARVIGAEGNSSLPETSHIVVAEESEVSRSPRSRRGYSKLKVVSEPPSEAVIANSHAVEGNLEPLSPNRIPAPFDDHLSSKESGKEDFKLVNLTSSPRVVRRGGGEGIVISNEATDEMEQTKNPENAEEEEQPDSPVVVASSMTDEQLSPLRRSRSEDASLFRQIKPNEDEDPLLRSTSQQPNNCPSFTIAQSFSEFVPGAKSTGVQFSPLHPHDSERPPLLKDPGRQPSTVYEESSGVEEGASEVPVSYFSPVHDSSPSREGSWTPVSAAVVWQRMLRMLGDVNKISQPAIHALAMSYVRDIWKTLEEIEANLGISIDNMGPPSCPDHMPPMMLLIPWVVKACSLSAEYSEGRKVAYKLLCEMVLRHSSSSPSLSLLPHFYHLLHLGLQPATCPEDELNVVVKASCQLFSFGLPGSTVLLHDCLSVCTHILSTRSTSVPRIEALTLLGSMQYLLVQYKETPLPIPGSGGKTRLGSVLRDNLTRTLFAAACKEPLRQSRCLALHQVGMLAYTELRSPHPSKSVTESMNILLASLRFSDIPVAMVAMDMLTLLVEVAEPMEQHFSSSPAVVLGALSSSLASSLLQKEEKTLKVIISLLFCLRDWVMALPVQRLVSEGTIPQPVFTAIFEVLHYAANMDDSQSSSVPRVSSFPVDVKLQPLEPTKTRTISNVSSSSSSSPGSTRQQQQGGLQPSVSKQEEEWVEQIKTAARAVLSHLINQLGHFPFSCGAAQMSSVVSEYHDCPSLRFLNELSTEIFYLPRVQFLALNHSAIITLIEIPTTTKVDGVSVATFETRVIVRDVIGKHSWDCAILYGPDSTPRHQSYIGDRSPVLASAPSSESLHSAATDSEHSADHPGGAGGGMTRNPHDPPTWRSHTSDDILNDLLGHLESTSPECLPHPGVVGMTAPAPAINQFTDITEGRLLSAVEQQRRAEIQYHSDTYSLPCMEAIPVKAPEHVPSMFAFHHCRVFLSHLGLLSWNRRNCLDVLEKNEQLIRDLKHLDGTLMQCRQTYKVAVLYVAHGQEDRYSVLCNNKGSRGFEEFVAGLGWEVDMETHAGYMGGLNRTFCKGCTLPYYATSSEEILFHVSTRMPSKGKDIEQVRHLGNDEIHIVWSEHWRDYRRTVFKTHFADVLIIIYPLPNNLFRVQINRKDRRTNVSFGPLFDGAVVDKACLPSLVRATAINASRALRTPLVAYRGRYPERFNIIQDVMKMKVKCSYEDFAQSVIHPIEFDPSSSSAPPTIRHSPVKQLAPATSIYSIKHGSSPETRWSMSPKVSSLLKLTRSGSKGHSGRKSKKYLDREEITRRPRSKTVEETMSLSQLQSSSSSSHVSRSQRHVSVPDNLPSLGISVERGPASPTLSIITSPVDAGSRSHSLSTVNSPLAVTTGFHLPSEQR